MLRKLFKRKTPGLDARQPDERLAAIARLAGQALSDAQPQLAELARADADPRVRHAAVDLLDDRALLAELLREPALEQAAATRLVQLGGLPEQTASHPGVFLARLAAAPDIDQARRIALETGDASLQVRAALRFPELRESLLSGPVLRSETGLTLLEKQTRGHDKSLNRLARDQLEQLRHDQREHQQRHARLEELAGKLARLDVTDPASPARYEGLAAEFRVLAEAEQTASQRLADWQIMLPPVPELPAPPAFPEREPEPEADAQVAASTAEHAEPEPPTTAEPEPPAPLPATEAIPAPDLRSLAESRLAEVQADLPVFSREDLVLPDPFPERATDMAPIHARAEALREHRQALRQALRRVDWPATLEVPPEISGWRQALELIDGDLLRLKEAANRHIDALDPLLDTFERALDTDSLQDANRTHQQLAALADWRGDGLPRRQARRLTSLRGRLRRLRDWQAFATAPKREALCDAMETLAAQPVDPEAQADRIKVLRAEWQALGRPASAGDHRLAERFNTAADQAFAPCKAYFEEQAAAREANARACTDICNQLETYLDQTDWQQADLKAADRILRTAREEWRRQQPLPRSNGRALSERFENLQSSLFEQLKRRWDANLARKQALVEEAERIAGTEAMPPRERIIQVKALQQQWQAVGPTPRKPDQALWQAFRQACDRVFSTLDQARAESQAAEQAALTAQRAWLEEFAALVRSTEPATADTAVLRDQARAFQALAPVSGPDGRACEQRFRELEQAYRSLLQQQAAAARRNEIEAFAQWDQQRADALAQGTDYEAPHPWLTAAATDMPEDLAGAARDLAITAELAANRPSPGVDEARRLELQVVRLNANLRERRDDLDDPMALLQRWCALPPDRPPAVAEYRTRFFQALSELVAGAP